MGIGGKESIHAGKNSGSQKVKDELEGSVTEPQDLFIRIKSTYRTTRVIRMVGCFRWLAWMMVRGKEVSSNEGRLCRSSFAPRRNYEVVFNTKARLNFIA